MTQQTTIGSADNLPQLPGYETLEVIGKGGFGRVYKVRDVRMKRIAAAKSLLHSEVSLGALFAEFKSRFEREVVITANLTHPNIVTAYTTLTDSEGNFYLVLEYVPGGTLAQLMQERQTLPLDLAIQIAVDICDALDVVWKDGIVHRDIKPNNIFLVKDNKGNFEKAKLADFGVAMTSRETRATTSPTQRGAHPGTPLYMSPEQAEGRPFLDVRSDLYSLGLVLYEMVHGKAYRTSTTPWADVSSPIDSVLKKLLRDNPAERYATPIELKRDLLLIRSGKALPTDIAPGTRKQQSVVRTLLMFGAPIALAICLTIAAIAALTSNGLLKFNTGATSTGIANLAQSPLTTTDPVSTQAVTPEATKPRTLEPTVPSTFTPTATQQPSKTFTATYTPTASNTAIPTEQVTPTDTSIPTAAPSFPLPFIDNFTGGLKSDWKVISGDPIITNGRLGTATEEVTLELGDDSLCDYALEFDYFGYPDDVIFAFARDFRYVMHYSGAGYEQWQVFRNNKWSRIAEGPGVGEKGHMQIMKIGSTYSLSINGKAYFDVTYGNPVCNPLQLTISDDDDFLDNLSISKP